MPTSAATTLPPPWSADQVLSLAPDSSAQRAARALAGDQAWCEAGLSADEDLPPTVWGLCQGSGTHPYQICVDLTEPAYTCSCPSRKFPCKHTLAMLLRWASGAVPEAPAPAWVREWQASRADRPNRATSARGEARNGGESTGRAAGEKAVLRRAERVAAGLAELDRWLADQIRGGLAGVARLGYEQWDVMGARLIDAQAPGAARLVRNLAGYAGDPERLLAELGLLRLLSAGFSRLDSLPPALAATVRLRVGIPVAAEVVLAGEAVRDRWQVLGVRDEQENDLIVRRVWLRGAATGRAALVLSFAGPGQVFVTDLLVGTEVDADLCFYPDHVRVLIARRHAPAAPITTVAGARPVAEAMREYASALAADPWLERWPMVLTDVVPVRAGPSPAGERWCLTAAGEPGPGRGAGDSGDSGGTAGGGAGDNGGSGGGGSAGDGGGGGGVGDGGGSGGGGSAGDGGQGRIFGDGGTPAEVGGRLGVPVDPAAGAPWRLVAAAGGRPVTVVGEWTASGLRPLTAWIDTRLVRL